MAVRDDAVLVVEDEFLVRMDLALALRTAGYRVIEAEDGEVALRWIHELGGLAALVTDFQMPRSDGVEVARVARARWPALPVIVVSGAAGAADAFQVVEGARVTAKPLSADLVLSQLSELLEARGAG